MKKISIRDIQKFKELRTSFATITAYDYVSAQNADAVGIPLLFKHKLVQRNLFSISRYAFLLFGILFAYEAIAHI